MIPDLPTGDLRQMITQRHAEGLLFDEPFKEYWKITGGDLGSPCYAYSEDRALKLFEFIDKTKTRDEEVHLYHIQEIMRSDKK